MRKTRSFITERLLVGHKESNQTKQNDPKDGVSRSNSTFSEHGHVAYQIKWNHEMQQHGSKYFAHRPPLPPDPSGMGSIGQKSTFSEHGDVAYQNKRNHEFSNMIAIFFHAYPLPP